MRYLFLLLVPVLLFGSCAATAEAEKVATEFHKRLDNREYDYIMDNLIHEEELNSVGREGWEDFFATVDSWGKIRNREQTSGFSTKINNGVTTCKLSYTFETDLGLVHERVVLVDRGDGFMVGIVSMNSDESIVEEYTKDY